MRRTDPSRAILVFWAAKAGRPRDWAEAFFLGTQSSASDGDEPLHDQPPENPAPTP